MKQTERRTLALLALVALAWLVGFYWFSARMASVQSPWIVPESVMP